MFDKLKKKVEETKKIDVPTEREFFLVKNTSAGVERNTNSPLSKEVRVFGKPYPKVFLGNMSNVHYQRATDREGLNVSEPTTYLWKEPNFLEKMKLPRIER